ncbi:MAG: SlyX family protein [Pseudomonadota bacterium]|nr:SlyX family protein [Pseudomonadota bacterium]
MEARIQELEIKLSFCEDLLDTLNTTVVRQQQQMDRLQAELRVLRQQIAAQSEGGTSPTLRDELPPHY